MSALTGAAAVNIFGETVHSACYLNNKRIVPGYIDEWKDTMMVIIDEISFASYSVLQNINEKLNTLKEVENTKYFGDIPIVFAGDFTQLEPVKQSPLFLNKNNYLWYDCVNTFLELKTNHRFGKKSEWGKLLQRMRTSGSPEEDLAKINSRVINGTNDITENDIPHDAVYAVHSNIDKAAINDAIFAKFVASTHSKNPGDDVPLHTICIKASNMAFTQISSNEYNLRSVNMSNIVFSSCGDGHVKTNDDKRYDPMLKLYKGRPICINENIDVKNCIANGAMGKFKGVIFEDNISVEDLDKIIIDGYYVSCADASMIKAIVVEMIDGNIKKDDPKIVHLVSQKVHAQVHYPVCWDGPISKHTNRVWRKIKFEQFPIIVANARTVHKLQGRSINNLVISTWNYTGNWVYVVLSRCRSLNGIFLRKPLRKTRPMSDMCKKFHDDFRATKCPKDDNIYIYT